MNKAKAVTNYIDIVGDRRGRSLVSNRLQGRGSHLTGKRDGRRLDRLGVQMTDFGLTLAGCLVSAVHMPFNAKY